MSYLDKQGVNKLWNKCKAKFATKEEVNNSGGSGNATPLYKHDIWCDIASTGYDVIPHAELRFQLETPENTPYNTTQLIMDALKNYGGTNCVSSLHTMPVTYIYYGGNNDGISIYSSEDEFDAQVELNIYNDEVSPLF